MQRQDHANMTTEAARATDWLARGGLRPTRQRLALARLLVGDGQDRHVTAESLFALTGGAGEKVSLATVYNTLRAFAKRVWSTKSWLTARAAILTRASKTIRIFTGKTPML
jgi:hypothetical protein